MKLYALLNIILCFSNIAYSQELSDDYVIEMGNKNLQVSEPFVISVVLRDVENRVPVVFPDISGLEKQSRSVTSAISNDQGKKIVVQTISQQYYASKPGRYVIPSFTILVNGVRVKSEEAEVVFSSSLAASDEQNPEDEQELLPDAGSVNKDIFLSVQCNKRKVFIREGFSVRLSLFVAENAPVEMEFYQFNQQLQGMLKKLRPVACWEENIGIEEIVRRKVRIKGRAYTEYNMYQATLFPLTQKDIILPAVSLDMLLLQEKGGQKAKVTQPFTSRPVTIEVAALPPHPFRDQVPVGQYQLYDHLSNTLVYPGESVRYVFKVEGTGNIAAIPAPETQASSTFDFYPPDNSHIIRRSDGGVSGEKTFDYFIVPRRDGTFPLDRYFQWIYFDPVAAKYDTLRAQRTLQVKGEDYRLGNISLNGATGLYDNLEKMDTSRATFDFKKVLKDVTNTVVILLLIAMIWVFRK